MVYSKEIREFIKKSDDSMKKSPVFPSIMISSKKACTLPASTATLKSTRSAHEGANAGDYLKRRAPHVRASFSPRMRNSALSDPVIYVGSAWAAVSGFYFLLRDNVSCSRYPCISCRNPSRSSAILSGEIPAPPRRVRQLQRARPQGR